MANFFHSEIARSFFPLSFIEYEKPAYINSFLLIKNIKKPGN